MLTHVVTLGVYCPQTRETFTQQIWLHAGPFDTGATVLARLEASLVQAPADWYEVIDSRHQSFPTTPGTPWEQLPLFPPSTPA